MKDFNNTAANVGQVIVAIDALVQTSASKAYIVHSNAAQALPIDVQNASYQGQDAASIRVAVDDAELENYVASAGSVVEVVELPDSSAARAKLLAEWAKKIAKKNKAGLLPLLLLPLAACGGGDSDAPAPTFVVTDSGVEVSFGGTVTGDITATVNGAVTTFVRGGLAQTVGNLFTKTLNIDSGQTVVIDVTEADGTLTPGVGTIAAVGAGNLTIDARDAGLGVTTGIALNVNIALTGGTLTFDMTNDDQDVITLTGSVSLGGGCEL